MDLSEFFGEEFLGEDFLAIISNDNESKEIALNQKETCC